MPNLLEDAWNTYVSNIKLVVLFSIPFIIAFLIPLFAPLPTFISSGGIFLRTASIFLDLNANALIVIIVSTFLSLLFLSFAFVAISLIVKAKRTYTKHAASVLRDVEKYTARVFVVLLVYAFILVIVKMLSYSTGAQGVLTPLIGFFLFMAIFYAPTAIVIDNKRVGAALSRSVNMVAREPQYFLLWLVLLTIAIAVPDFILIKLTGTLVSSYAMLFLNSLFILPYFVILQAEAYMKRFPLLKR